MALTLVLVVVLAVWTPLSTAQVSTPAPPCPFVTAEAVGNETASMATQEDCFRCLGSTCGFAYFSILLPGNPCRQILNGTSNLLTRVAFRQCGLTLLDCDSPACNGTCSPCVTLSEVAFTQSCVVTPQGFRVCQQRRCSARITRIRVTSPAQAAMTGDCAQFCTAQLGCEAYVETNTSCVTLQNLANQGIRDLSFANATGCVDQTVTDFCFNSPCQNGGQCVNRTDNFECLCRQGYSGPTCNISAMLCPGVVTTTGVSAMVSSYTVGSNVTYLCLDNFLPVSGDALQTCLANFTWSGSPLMCDPVVTYTVRLRVLGRAFSLFTLTLFGSQRSSPTVNVRLVGWGFFARGVTAFVRSTDLGPLQRAVVELLTGNSRASLVLQMQVTAPDGAVFSFPTTTLSGGDVRDLPATRLTSTTA